MGHVIPETLRDLLLAGGGARVAAGHMMPNTLVDLAKAAAIGGGTLTLVGIGHLMPDVLIAIARAGHGHVIFDYVTE